MARGRTPLITVVLPAVEDCDDEEIGKELLEMSYGNKKLNFDIIHVPVTVTARDKDSGKVVLEREYDPKDWDCLESFLDDFRRGLDIDISPESIEFLEGEVEDFKRRLGIAREDYRQLNHDYNLRTDELRMLRKESVEIPRLGTAVDLETRARARGDLEYIAGLRLHRWSHPLISRIVQEARRLV